MYNKNNLHILKERIKRHPKASPNILFYYLGIAKFRFESNEYTENSYGISFRFNKFNPLTMIYLAFIYMKLIIKGINKGHKMYKNVIADMQGTTHMIYLNE